MNDIDIRRIASHAGLGEETVRQFVFVGGNVRIQTADRIRSVAQQLGITIPELGEVTPETTEQKTARQNEERHMAFRAAGITSDSWIEDIDCLTVRALNAIFGVGAVTVRCLASHDVGEILGRGVGKVTIAELDALLEFCGLKWGTPETKREHARHMAAHAKEMRLREFSARLLKIFKKRVALDAEEEALRAEFGMRRRGSK